MPTFGARHQFTLPYTWPSDDRQEHENWVAIEQWANTFGQTPYDAAFFDIVADGTKSSYTFGVPNIYTDLWYEICGTGSTASDQQIQLQCNGDVTAAHYLNTIVFWAYGAAGVSLSSSATFPQIARFIADSSRAQIGQGIIGNYNSPTMRKPVSINCTTVSSSSYMAFGGGSYEENNPITSITLALTSGTIAAGTTIKFGGVW
jgi:hypothetical protein